MTQRQLDYEARQKKKYKPVHLHKQKLHIEKLTILRKRMMAVKVHRER